MNKISTKFPNDLVYLSILSLPILAIFSIFLLEIFLITISAIFLFQVFKSKEFFYFNNFFFKFFLIFYIYLLSNFVLQIDKINTLSIIFYFRYIIYTLAIYYFLDKKEKLFLNFLKTVLCCVIVLGLDAIIQSIFGTNLIGLKLIENNRASSFFGDELILGSYIFRILPFIFVFLLLENDNFPKTPKVISMFLSFVIIFLSGERTSLILSLILLITYIFLFKEKKIIKILKYLITILLIIFSLLLIFSKKYQHRFIFQPLDDLSNNYKVTKDLLEGYSHEPKVLFFSGLHHNLMVTSFRIFENNKIFGSGPRSYRTECHKYKINRFSCDRHPHNYYIQLLSETGLIGVSCLILIYILIIKELYLFYSQNNKTDDFLKFCFLAFYFAALWPIIPSGNFFNNWLSIMNFLPFSFYLYLNKKLDTKN